MRGWMVAAAGLALAGPAAGQSSDLAQAIDRIRGSARILSYANMCVREPDRIELVLSLVVRAVSYGRPQAERDLLQTAMDVETIYYGDVPKSETCPAWIERFYALEQAVRR